MKLESNPTCDKCKGIGLIQTWINQGPVVYICACVYEKMFIDSLVRIFSTWLQEQMADPSHNAPKTVDPGSTHIQGRDTP
jgi:hypothetical protein